MTTIYPVIMAGGSGTRLWPLSRQAAPKQFQSLVTDRTMLEETISRVDVPAGVNARLTDPIVICGEAHRRQVEEIAAHASIPLNRLIVEPVGRNTAPAAIVASLAVAAEDPEGLILLLPADHHVAAAEAFHDALGQALHAAKEGFLTTFGIEASRPETGYGYIRAGDPLSEGVSKVDRFVEKPNAETAATYIADGRYTWNAGIFLFRAQALLDAAQEHAEDILADTRAAFDAATREDLVIKLDPSLFAAIRAESIDYAIMEHTDKAAMVGPVRMGWNDIGSWRAVRDQLAADGASLTVGDVVTIDCENSLIRSDGPLVTAVGLKDLIVVATKDSVLILPADRAQEVKTVVDRLQSGNRADLL